MGRSKQTDVSVLDATDKKVALPKFTQHTLLSMLNYSRLL